jgi:hypothetical protein
MSFVEGQIPDSKEERSSCPFRSLKVEFSDCEGGRNGDIQVQGVR